MTDARVQIIFTGLTHLIVTTFIGAAWMFGKVTSAEAMIPLLALSGLEIAGRANKRGSVPPAGPTALSIFFVLQSLPPSLFS